jgi:hypothetical protein
VELTGLENVTVTTWFANQRAKVKRTEAAGDAAAASAAVAASTAAAAAP